MAFPKVKLSDDSGNEVAVTSNALDVNIAGGASIDIGDVDMFLDGGTALLGGAGAVASGVLRVTLASDDPAVASLDEIESAIENLELCIGVDGDTGPTRCLSIAGTSGVGNIKEIAVDSSGNLQVDLVTAAVTNAGTFAVQVDGDALTSLQLLDDAIYADDADFTFNSDKGMLVMGVNSSTQNITLNDVGAITVDERGQVRTVQNLGEIDTFVMLDIDNAAEQLSSADSNAVGTQTDCIEMIFQADESNSGYVMIGDSDVADNRGIKLNAGDTFILTSVDTRAVYLWGSAANQNVRCTLMRSDV